MNIRSNISLRSQMEKGHWVVYITTQSIVKFNLLQMYTCDIASTAAFVLSGVSVRSCRQQVMRGWCTRDSYCCFYSISEELTYATYLLSDNAHTFYLTGKCTNAICHMKRAETPSHHMQVWLYFKLELNHRNLILKAD